MTKNATKPALSTVVKNQTKLIQEQTAKIVELEKQLKLTEASKDSYWKSYQEEKAVTDGLHEVLDDLGIRGWKDDNKYYRVPLAVRLFSWALQLKTAKE